MLFPSYDALALYELIPTQVYMNLQRVFELAPSGMLFRLRHLEIIKPALFEGNSKKGNQAHEDNEGISHHLPDA